MRTTQKGRSGLCSVARETYLPKVASRVGQRSLGCDVGGIARIVVRLPDKYVLGYILVLRI